MFQSNPIGLPTGGTDVLLVLAAIKAVAKGPPHKMHQWGRRLSRTIKQNKKAGLLLTTSFLNRHVCTCAHAHVCTKIETSTPQCHYVSPHRMKHNNNTKEETFYYKSRNCFISQAHLRIHSTSIFKNI